MEAPEALRKYIREFVRTVYDRKVNDMKIDYHWRHPSDIEHPLQPGWYDYDHTPGKLSAMPGRAKANNKRIPFPGEDYEDKEDIRKEVNNESLRNWFKKEDWVRIDTQGNIAGKCGTMPKGKKTQRCLPRAKAQSLTKKERAATSRKKTRSKKQFVKNTKKAKVSLKK